jgi:4-amino-4-deoxy-L-arabinose transferase-like glycosyltransferase
MTSAATLVLPVAPATVPVATSPLSDRRHRLDWLFRAWLLSRTLLWTLVATLTQHAPPLDTVEWLCWGHEWQLGYYKHPPLAAWVAEIAFHLTPGSFFGIYLAGYVAIAVALWCVWRLARRMLPPREALAATVCLDGLVFFHQGAAEFNNQVLLIAFWALAIFLFHRALTADRWRDWIGTGIALGLTLLCKYSAVFLIVPLLGLWLWRDHSVRRLSRPGVVALAAAMVFLPHFVWLCRHDFQTLRYAAERAQGETAAYDHRLSAVTFVLSQGLRLLPVAMVLMPLLRGRAEDRRMGRMRRMSPIRLIRLIRPILSSPNRTFVAIVVLAPLALHLIASLALGVTLRDIWGAPLWAFVGLLAILFLETDTTERAWRRMGLAWAGVTALTLAVVLAGNLAGGCLGKPYRIHYPGAQLSAELTGRWQQRFGTPVPIVAGDWWLAGLVCCHAPHRPSLYASLEPAAFGMDPYTRPGDPRRYASPDLRTSPWTGDADLCTRGGLLVWDADCYGEDIPEWLRERFPDALPQPALNLKCAAGGPMLHVGWAMIAPVDRINHHK